MEIYLRVEFRGRRKTGVSHYRDLDRGRNRNGCEYLLKKNKKCKRPEPNGRRRAYI